VIERIVTPVLGVNCYVLACDKTKKAAIIDPGSGSAMIKDLLRRHNLEVERIILTHGHYDHIGAAEELRKTLHAEVAVHREDAGMLTDPQKNLSRMFSKDYVMSPAEILLEDGQKFFIGEVQMKVIHTPGHTPGGICLLTDGVLFSGDTLFDCSIGRADLPGGDFHKLLNSIHDKLMVLDDQILVYPGHESFTSIGRERARNPYISGDLA